MKKTLRGRPRLDLGLVQVLEAVETDLILGETAVRILGIGSYPEWERTLKYDRRRRLPSAYKGSGS